MIKASPGQEKETYEQILSLGVRGVREAEDCATTGWRDMDGNLPSNREVAMSIYLGLLQIMDALYQGKRHKVAINDHLILAARQVLLDYSLMVSYHFKERKIEYVLK